MTSSYSTLKSLLKNSTGFVWEVAFDKHEKIIITVTAVQNEPFFVLLNLVIKT